MQNTLTPDEYKEKFYNAHKNRDYILLSEYKNGKHKVKVKHVKCNYIWDVQPNNALKLVSCPKCKNKNKKSSLEDFIYNYIRTIYSGRIYRNLFNKIVPKHEIDIYIPKLNIAFEINGLYWHSTKFKDKDFHKTKTSICKQKGISLVQLYEDEIKKRPIAVKNEIDKSFNIKPLNIIKINKCKISYIEYDRAKDFIHKNNLKSDYIGDINLGVFYKNKLISCISFKSNVSNRYIGLFDCELVSYTNKFNYLIQDGFNILFNKILFDYNFKKVMYYQDKRFTKDNFLSENKFIKYKIIKPKKYYLDSNNHYKYKKDIPKDGRKIRGTIYNCGYIIYSYVID